MKTSLAARVVLDEQRQPGAAEAALVVDVRAISVPRNRAMNEKPTKSVGRRVAAILIDTIIVVGVNFAIFFALAGDPVEASRAAISIRTRRSTATSTIGDSTYSVYGATAGLYFFLSLAITIGYFVVWQGLKGVTVGKLMLGIVVVKDDGSRPPGIGRAFARWFLQIADAFPYFIPYLTGFIVAKVSKDNKDIGDMVASTHRGAQGRRRPDLGPARRDRRAALVARGHAVRV